MSEEKIKWEDVTTVELLHEYIKQEIGWEHVYDEMYQDYLYAMIYNREQKEKNEKLQKKLSDMGGIILPNG